MPSSSTTINELELLKEHYLPKHDHISVASTITHRIAKNKVLCSASKINLQTINAMISGNTQ